MKKVKLRFRCDEEIEEISTILEAIQLFNQKSAKKIETEIVIFNTGIIEYKFPGDPYYPVSFSGIGIYSLDDILAELNQYTEDRNHLPWVEGLDTDYLKEFLKFLEDDANLTINQDNIRLY